MLLTPVIDLINQDTVQCTVLTCIKVSHTLPCIQKKSFWKSSLSFSHIQTCCCDHVTPILQLSKRVILSEIGQSNDGRITLCLASHSLYSFHIQLLLTTKLYLDPQKIHADGIA